MNFEFSVYSKMFKFFHVTIIGNTFNSPCLHESSNPGSTHFQSRTEFQSTNGCGSSQSGVHTGGESGLNLCLHSCANGAYTVTIREWHTPSLSLSISPCLYTEI